MMKMLTRLAGIGLLVTTQALAQTAPQADSAQEKDAEAARAAQAARAEAQMVAEEALATRVEATTARAAAAATTASAAEEYSRALEAAAIEQREALQAVESAQRELSARAIEQREREASQDAREQEQMKAMEMQEVQRELQRAHENLRRASREVARVHRNISRPAPHVTHETRVHLKHDDRAIIGVILGGSNDNGVEILGVSPDGPAERAGLAQGDVIVAVMGERLAGSDQPANQVLGEVMEGVVAGDELSVQVDREGETREFTVIPEKREPFTWHSYSRLPSAPTVLDGEPGTVIVERIEVPEIDRETLDREMARLRQEFDQARIVIDTQRSMSFSDGEHDFVYELEDFSEFGDAVLSGTNIWFGMPLTQGLKMAEVDADLGEYFKTERGVLVLKARADNELQLQAGDVILAVGGTEVNKPADVMRALRDLESGSELDIDIKRNRKELTLVVDLPENQHGFLFEKFPALSLYFNTAPNVDVKVLPVQPGSSD